jgi:hypothetical protein
MLPLLLRRTRIFVVALGALACRAPDDCAGFAYGLNVYVSDRNTQIGLVDVQTVVVANDGSFLDTATLENGTFNAADGRPGHYTVTAERAGYQKWTQSNVVVRSEGCHIAPVSLHARLQPTTQ